MRRAHRNALFLSSALGGLILMGLTGPARSADQTYQFDIPAEPLGQALTDFSKAASQQIVFSEEVTSGKSTAGLHGRYTATAALRALLAGTDLAVDTNSSGVMAVRSKNVQAAQNEGAASNGFSLQSAYSTETVVVSGSRIQRTGYDQPTPTTVLAPIDLNQGQRDNIAEMLTDQPQFRGTNSTPQANTINSNAGKYQIDLRGIGLDRTLTLLDGHRFIGSNDLNSVPQNIVKRVDIVTGGASAAWGSGAVAGVVNIILDDEISDLTLNAQSGISSRGDTIRYEFDGSWGSDFAGGRGHFEVSAEYLDQSGAYGRDDGRRKNVEMSLFTAPNGTLSLEPDVNLIDASPGGTITSGPLAGMVFNKNGTLSPVSLGSISNSNSTVGGSGRAQFDNDPVTNPDQRMTLFMRGSYNIFQDAKIWVDVDYTRSYANYPAFTDTVEGTTTSGLLISSDNAFLSPAIKAALGPGQTFYMGRMFSDISASGVQNFFWNRNLIEASIGIDGTFDGNWQYRAYFDHGENRNRFGEEPLRDPNHLALALDSINSPSTGKPICRIALTDPTTNCVPYNPFGIGNASAAALAYVFPAGDNNELDNGQLDAYGVSLSGDLLRTWAGPVSVSAGMEGRRESQDNRAGAQNVPGNYFSSLSGSFNVIEGFGEAVLPVLDVPQTAKIELNGAGRYSDYSNTGGIWSWKGGITARLFDDLLLRGVLSRDIRSPSATELFTPQGQTGLNINDSATGKTYTVGIVTGGNPNLKPEIGNTTTVGFTYTPSFIPGLGFSADLYSIYITGAIGTLPAQDFITQCNSGVKGLCQYVPRDPVTGLITVVGSTKQNLGFYKQKGVDLEATYSIPFDTFVDGGSGDIQIRALATFIDTIVVNNGYSSVKYAGMVGDASFSPDEPHWRSTVSATYQNDGYGFNVRLRYVGGGLFDRSLPITNNDVSGQAYVDIGGNYNIGNITLYGNVNNLFDKDPPPIVYYSQIYDVVGRYFSAGVKVRF